MVKSATRAPLDAARQGRAFQIMRREMRRGIPRVLGLLALMVTGTGLGLLSPLLFKTLIDRAIPTKNESLVLWTLAGLGALPVLSVGLFAGQKYLRSGLGESVNRALRETLCEHLLRTRLPEIERMRTGEFAYALFNHCGALGLYVSERLLPLVANVILLAGNLATMLCLNVTLLLLTLLAFPPAFALNNRLRRYTRPLDARFSDTMKQGMSDIQELFSGFRTVRAFNAEEHEWARWREWLRRLWQVKARSALFHDLVRVLPGELINNAVMGIVFGYGAFEVIRGRMSIGGLVAFVAYIPRVYTALRAMLDAQIETETARVAAEELDRLFALERERDGGRTLARPRSAGAAIAFENVLFHYGRGDFNIEELTFRVEPGEFLGIVGASGGGKSTVIDLLLGFYTPHAGTIRIDGVDLGEWSLASLRDQIGYVPQDVFLWHATIRDNIRYPCGNVAPAAVAEAARVSQMHAFIESLPQGYETVVGERGLSLSGGERQRLAISRAVLREPRLLLLDEATSALDALTELKVRDAIERAKQGRTTLVVAHRLATVIHADRVLVMEQGRIAEMGTPRELLARRGLFHDLYQAQKLDIHA